MMVSSLLYTINLQRYKGVKLLQKSPLVFINQAHENRKGRARQRVNDANCDGVLREGVSFLQHIHIRELAAYEFV